MGARSKSILSPWKGVMQARNHNGRDGCVCMHVPAAPDNRTTSWMLAMRLVRRSSSSRQRSSASPLVQRSTLPCTRGTRKALSAKVGFRHLKAHFYTLHRVPFRVLLHVQERIYTQDIQPKKQD